MKKIITLLILTVMVQPVLAIGIGISPSEININNGFKGAEYEKSLVIFNTGQEQTNFSLSAEGDISDWVSIYKSDNLSSNITNVLIPGEDKVSLIIVFRVPSDASNGNYSGVLDVNSVPSTDVSEGSQSQMVVGASSYVMINVTGDQILQGEVTSINIEDTEVEYPLKTNILIKNTGNVVASPKIESHFYRGDEEVGSLVNDSASIKPTGVNEKIVTKWNTHGQAPGNYTLNVIVSLDGQTLKSENISFTIYPTGTFSRQGNLTDILIEGEPEVDKVSKITAYFNNTGQIETSAKFTGEVYKDEELLDTIKSDELTVDKYKQAVLVGYFKPTTPGEYVIKGKVVYSGKETPVNEVSFKVPGGFQSLFISGAVAIFLILALLAVMVKKKKNN
ncbi:hypothetical protein MSSAC_4083 [Methanosarcina siciliae C2J]|uniref:Uncharacterized protein n=1 Tax=Methanosarcina siciliae C2J TaxID=1434118 RepID=A0A0E3PTN9_9EURY|nr:hypothetical protein [Methanosarcina siciliae]AKB38673.1 hypothetical protein MSSAC_4083 [Methanosarcina siciliae C2J]